MARRKRKVNKTQAVKEFLVANPEYAPREVAEALNQQGIPVRAQYVSAIKSRMANADSEGESAAPEEAPAPRRRGRPARSASPVGAAVGYKSLLEAKTFVRSIGGISEARKVLDAYANLQ